MQVSVSFARDMICALNAAKRNCLFPDLKPSTESNNAETDEVRKAYQKGRLDILCSLTDHGFISMDVAEYMAGMDQQGFEKALLDWRYDWMVYE